MNETVRLEMRATFHFLFAVAMMFMSACAREHTPLHQLAEGEREILKIKLLAGAKHEFSVKVEVPVWASISTDASFEAMKKYGRSNPLPVRLEHREKRQAVSTVKGAGKMRLTPVGGEIPLRLINETDEDLEILVYGSEN